MCCMLYFSLQIKNKAIQSGVFWGKINKLYITLVWFVHTLNLMDYFLLKDNKWSESIINLFFSEPLDFTCAPYTVNICLQEFWSKNQYSDGKVSVDTTKVGHQKNDLNMITKKNHSLTYCLQRTSLVLYS